MEKSAEKPSNSISKFKKFILIILVTGLYLAMSYRNVESKGLDGLDLICPLEAPKLTQLELITSTKSRLSEFLADFDELILLPQTPEIQSEELGVEHPGLANIMYVLGKYDILDSYVMIDPTCSPICTYVLLPQYSEREIIFSGSVYNRTELIELYDLAGVMDLTDLPAFAKGRTILSSSQHFLTTSSVPTIDVQVYYSSDIEQAFIASRFAKTQEELTMLTYAAQVARYAHQEVESAIKEFSHVTESKLYGLFSYISTVCRCSHQSYDPIVGAAEHSYVLHFPTGASADSGNTEIEMKDFILIDAAGAYKGYASDLTRTYAREDSERKRVISSIVLNAQHAGFKAYKVGNKWSKVVDDTLVKLTEGLWKSGMLVSDSLQPLLDAKISQVFMPHGVGHPVGLNVHDPYPSITEREPAVSIFGKEYETQLQNDYFLAPGHVNTIEPGVYMIPYLLNLARNESYGVRDLINWKMVEEWKGVGVRIEDVLSIERDGSTKVLTMYDSNEMVHTGSGWGN